MRVRRLVPRSLPVRQLVAALVDALQRAYYVVSRCRGPPLEGTRLGGGDGH
ncbi:hypothetical protein [Pyrobaculum islandicum]|uniref:hypothetical protein n=1 Tax=Pyrobaculum islandicum TaxID=2277 RepID=UPI000AAE3814|nr:hypothetical protein [Pyrobaculum islandicum]